MIILGEKYGMYSYKRNMVCIHRAHRTRRVHIVKNISVIFSMASKEVKKPAGQNGSWEKHGLLCESVDPTDQITHF